MIGLGNQFDNKRKKLAQKLALGMISIVV